MAKSDTNNGFEHTRLAKYNRAIETGKMDGYYKRKHYSNPPSWTNRMRNIHEWAIQNQIENGAEWSFTANDALQYIKQRYSKCVDRLGIVFHLRGNPMFRKVGKKMVKNGRGWNYVITYRAV